MAKARTPRSGGSRPQKTNKRLWQAVLAVAVIGIMIGAFMLQRDSSSGDETSSSLDLDSSSTLRDRLVLPAKPQRPRPVILDPAGFTDPEIRRAYQAAKDTPEPIENMACYCGCFGTANHRNNLDCFKDSHGAT